MIESGAPRGRPGTDGFTLIEMLVTLAILSLAVTIGSQSIVGMQSDRRPVQIAETVAAEIGRLRAEALRSGRGGRLVFEPRSGRFLSSRPGAAAIATPGLKVSVETPPSDRPAPGEIRFLPDGSTTGGRILLSAATAGAALSIGALTGRVRREQIR